jgi:hypothetical protein
MSDIKLLQKEYEAAQARLAKLSEDLKAAQAAKFSSLPEQVGLKTVDALIKALIPFASGVTKGKLKTAFAGTPAAPAQKRSKPAKQKRAWLDDAAKEKIVAALKNGGKTAGAIASEFGVSVATINLMKAKAGLTKKKKK